MPDATVLLRWTGAGLEFEGGGDGGPPGRLDGDGRSAPSPMQTLLLALAGCTAADLVEILGKMRVPLESLDVRIEGDRAPEPPRRYTSLRLSFTIGGAAAEDESKLQRALALSLDKYCSVLHTLRPDLELQSEIVRG